MDGHVKRIEEGWDETKDKAQARLQLLQNTKAAWEGYAEGLETIATHFESAEEEIKKVKKRFNLQAAFEDLENSTTAKTPLRACSLPSRTTTMS